MKRNLDLLNRYLESRGIMNRSYATLLADAEGRIKSLAGLNADIGLVSPTVGSMLPEVHPVFEKLFPLKEESLVLPNVETHPDVYWDIHLLKAGPLTWVIFEDKSKQVEKLKPGIQARNEVILKSEPTRLPAANHLLKGLRYLVLENSGNGTYRVLEPSPDWATLFLTEEQSRFTEEELITIFPYLEVFTDRRDEARNRPVISDLWSQSDTDQNEYDFRAWWLYERDSFFLLIKQFGEKDMQHDLIQKARTVSLEKEEVVKSEQLARQLIQTKNQFVSIVSHDLRSPFISIISALDFLFEDPEFTAKNSDEHNEFLGYIHEESKRLLDYLEKLLNWTRLDTGKLQPQLQEVNLQALWKLSRNQFEQRVADKEIQLESSIPANFLLQADPTLFSQVINNLVGNAIKFTPRNGTIRLQAAENGEQKIIRVTDTGVGIPKEKQDTLFKEHEKYYTYGTEGEKGTGLGLAICKKICDAHGFRISCHSEEGEGTEMRIVMSDE